VSLDLAYAEGIPADVEWPEFPALRELCIQHGQGLHPIILKSKETLEHFIIHDTPSADIEYAVEMPRLTDLYMRGEVDNHEFMNTILRLKSQKNLEFLFIDNSLSGLDSTTIRLNKVEIVMLGACTKPSEEEKVMLTVMCPNAKILVVDLDNLLEMVKVVRGRRKQKGFTLDTDDLIIY
jgi:hypothetical protein